MNWNMKWIILALYVSVKYEKCMIYIKLNVDNKKIKLFQTFKLVAKVSIPKNRLKK